VNTESCHVGNHRKRIPPAYGMVYAQADPHSDAGYGCSGPCASAEKKIICKVSHFLFSLSICYTPHFQAAL